MNRAIEEISGKLLSLGESVPEKFQIVLTKYGVGGSYYPPNGITLKVTQKDVFRTAVHEMIHLVIHELIEEHHIDHWTKERIVDLIHGRFTGSEIVQKMLEKENEVREIFDAHYPNLRRIIQEIAKLRT